MLELAKWGSKKLAAMTEKEKNGELRGMAFGLLENIDAILRANEQDIVSARGTMPDVMLDRLYLDKFRVRAMAEGILAVAELPDPVGRVLESVTREDGLRIDKVSVPLGVLAIIYESRPNVTSDAAALAVKSGSTCVLRSGKEAWRSAKAIVDAMRTGFSLPGYQEFIQLVEDTSRESARELMTARGYVDLLIPRGGAGLIRSCVENATVPCLETGTGICHVYVDEYADLEKAVKILENAKMSRPSVCNACEVCLVHSAVAERFLPMLYEELVTKEMKTSCCPVEFRLDERARAIIDGAPAGERDFDTEFLDYILAVKVVDSVEEAISHIAAHSTHHSEAIVSENAENQEKFLRAVDSAAVYVNASTRFTDGGEFGLGCEMGISTQKLHARGPVGLRELTTYKYVIRGDGHVR